MADHGYRFDRRDTQFVLFEHLRAQRLFETPLHEHFHKSDVDLLLSEAIKLAENVLAACNESGDREGCRFDDGHVRVPPSYREAYRQQCAGGWMAISTEPEFGGHGLPFVFGASVGEAFIGANSALSMLPGLTRGACELLIACGNDEMKRQYVPHLVSGRWQGTMCLTEPHAGSAVGMVNTAASKRDGQYFIKGQKIFISGGDHDLVDNVIHLVLARVEGAPAGTKGLSLFLVPKVRVNADGSLGESNDVTCVGIEKKLGIHGSPTCALSFGDHDRCLGLLIGEDQQGIEIMFRMMNFARVGVGLQGVALGSAAYQFALDYARRRVQGVDMKNIRDPNAPSVLITVHPDVRRMLATMKAYVEGGRALLLYTALCLDLMTCSTDAAERERLAGRVELLTPLCKAWCTDTGFKVTELALQTLGGHGYLKDYPVEQHLRDVKIASIYEGTNGIQAIDLLGRKVGRKQGTLFLEFMGLLAEFIEAHRHHPQLGKSVEMLGERKNHLEQVTMNFAMSQMSGDLDYPLLSASPYLRVFTNVVVAWLLLEQGLVADAALGAIYAQAGAADDAGQTALRADHEDAQFYFNKIKTAQFFASNLLTENDGLVAAIESGDRSPLEMHF